jgi:DsbC/DsbD-like thiol-disulfide interchange protein
VLDEDLEAHHAVFGVATRPEQQGVAFPMTVVLDERGIIARKIVEENYRMRYGGHALAAEVLAGPLDQPRRQVATAVTGSIVSARTSLDAPSYFAFQRLGLRVELTVAGGWHVYGPVVPPGYTGLSIDVTSEPEGVRLGAIAWPATKPFRVAGLDEDFSVYDGTIRMMAPVEFRIPRNTGVARLAIKIQFQACSASECLPPSAIELKLAVPETPAL